MICSDVEQMELVFGVLGLDWYSVVLKGHLGSQKRWT